MRIMSFIFYDKGVLFVSTDGWIPGDLQPGETEAYPGQSAKFCAELYRCMVRKGLEALAEGTLNLPVFIWKQHRGETVTIDLETLKATGAEGR
jgi:hypothetical protein